MGWTVTAQILYMLGVVVFMGGCVLIAFGMDQKSPKIWTVGYGCVLLAVLWWGIATYPMFE